MRESEFWAAAERVFPHGRAASLMADLVLSSLGGRSPVEALAAGEKPGRVWEAVCEAMDLPERYQYLHRIRPEDMA